MADDWECGDGRRCDGIILDPVAAFSKTGQSVLTAPGFSCTGK